MNLCILLGKIVSEINFKFIVKSRNKSIAYFDMQLSNKSIIRIKSYDEVADYTYRKLKTGQIVMVEGKIKGDGTVECEHFTVRKTDKFWKKVFTKSKICYIMLP